MKPKIDESWLNQIGSEFEQPYMHDLRNFLQEEKASGKLIYPQGNHWFEAFNRTPFDKVKVVILGQDPYHGPNQAHGLCFSVPCGVASPPSLMNIYKELHEDIGKALPSNGDLSQWADEGVLLLNATLTVEAQKAGSHQNKGWEQFTDAAIAALNESTENLVFMLWGSYAQKKGAKIDSSKHLVLKAPHPSPLSSYRGFFGCKHFSKTNQYFMERGKPVINW